jgi:hypothetical protein
MGILWSCIITLGLCVWTSVHPDIIPNPTTLRITIRRVVWMFWALFTPELIVGSACVQRKNAKLVHDTWCAHFGIKPGSSQDNMGMEGAFFVVMGGFVVNEDLEAGEDGEKDDFTRDRCILTHEGFLHYLSKDQIPMDAINKRVIADKGKADLIAKFLVCLQALWMVFQCSARKATGLPITLLELHVVIQVFFVLVSYTQWFYKPLNINEPIILSLPVEVEESAFLRVNRYRNVFLEVMGSLQEASDIGSGYCYWMTLGTVIITSCAHMSAWNYPFPTYAEQILWRVSSIALATPSISLICELLDSSSHNFNSTMYNFIYRTTAVIFMLICIPLYLFSITFITVEAFISLRKVPLGTYDSVQWVDFWPHI